MLLNAENIKQIARDCGFELAGIAAAEPSGDFERFHRWRGLGMAGEMSYLTDHRGDKRGDPRSLLHSAKSILCVGKLYQTEYPLSTELDERGHAWISRYAWGADYHDVLRRGLEDVIACIATQYGKPFEWKICVDTAPLLERSYARAAGLGWIGKNTCLINEGQGSWFFLGELLLSLPLGPDAPPPDRCGSCSRCIDACPTQAIVPDGKGGFRLDGRLCISYLTIEKRGDVPGDLQGPMGAHVFGCDICQDVCPWNRRAPRTDEASFQPVNRAPLLEDLAGLTEPQFRERFKHSPIWRAKYSGFLRNVAIALGNSDSDQATAQLERLANHTDETVAKAARSALSRRQATTY
ncbi:MAG: tRNA epoxyqueuosine(34) reductase QueG [Bryobacteraceae bacterium]